jgi:HNH endonuclease
MAKAEILDWGLYCVLIIRDKHKHEAARAKFDRQHVPKIRELCWSLGSTGYPRNHRSRKTLHQIIMGEPPLGKEIDHINGDILDNRDANLRFVTHTQNMRNLRLSKRNKSGCRGVWWDGLNKAWQVKICYNRKQIFLGRYKKLGAAIKVRKAAETRYYREYTRAA